MRSWIGGWSSTTRIRGWGVAISDTSGCAAPFYHATPGHQPVSLRRPGPWPHQDLVAFDADSVAGDRCVGRGTGGSARPHIEAAHVNRTFQLVASEGALVEDAKGV